MDEQNNSILERIHAAYHDLTATERRLADYVLSNPDQVQFMSITQLADECGTGESTISRFCRDLELKGFNAFKLELAKHSAGAVKKPAQQDMDTPRGRWGAAAALSAAAIHQTLALLDDSQVQRAVELFEQANRIICVGSGGSMVLASEFAHLFSRVSPKFYAVTDSHDQMATTATLSPCDAVVLFSYSGATTGGLQVLELAKAGGVPTVLITRYPKSPAATLADVVLRCGSNEGPFQSGSVPAKVAQLTVIDILYQEYYHRNPAECEENIQRIAAALSGKHI